MQDVGEVLIVVTVELWPEKPQWNHGLSGKAGFWRNKNPLSILVWTCKANRLMPSAHFSSGTILADVYDFYCGYELHIIDSQRCGGASPVFGLRDGSAYRGEVQKLSVD